MISQYEVIRSGRKTIGAEIRKDKLIIRVPIYADKNEIELFIAKHKKWIESHLAKANEREERKSSIHKLGGEEIKKLKDEASELIPERVSYYAPLIGVTYGKITIRQQKTRWGSCSSKGNLNFNCLLMLAPPEVVDSVVVHELCHRKEMNHSDKFYKEVIRVFPEYWKWHKWLKDNGEILLERS